MKIFDLKNNNVIVEPQVLTVPEFKEIWDRDHSKNKDEAFKDFTYVYHMCDFNSPYSGYPEGKKEETILADVYSGKKKKTDKVLEKAMIKYQFLSSTPKQRFLQAVYAKFDQIAQYFTNTDMDDDSYKAILEIFKNVGNLVSIYDKVEEAAQKDKDKDSGASKRRGEKSTRLFEN